MKKFLLKKFLSMLAILGMFLTLGENFASAQGKILIAYFSRIGEEYSIGNVSKGNTQIVAEIIAEKVNGDLFEIKPIQSYPASYEECKTVASHEKAIKARPELANRVENFDQYDVIFVGYPIWYGDAPMPVYTFLESYDFSGKTIIPFCTHAGSGLSSTDQTITLTCPDSKLLQGFEIRGAIAHNDPAQTESRISSWLNRIGY